MLNITRSNNQHYTSDYLTTPYKLLLTTQYYNKIKCYSDTFISTSVVNT